MRRGGGEEGRRGGGRRGGGEGGGGEGGGGEEGGGRVLFLLDLLLPHLLQFSESWSNLFVQNLEGGASRKRDDFTTDCCSM